MHKDTEELELDYEKMADYAREISRAILTVALYWHVKGWLQRRARARMERALLDAQIDEVILGADAPGA